MKKVCLDFQTIKHAYEQMHLDHSVAWAFHVDDSQVGDFGISSKFIDPNPEISIKKPSKNDPVNHPPHYTFGKYEVIDVIEDWKLDFNLGNCVKYIARAGIKDPSKEIQDLEKAKFYLERQIKNLKGKSDANVSSTPSISKS